LLEFKLKKNLILQLTFQIIRLFNILFKAAAMWCKGH